MALQYDGWKRIENAVIFMIEHLICSDMIIDDQVLNIRCSIGMATYPINGNNSDELLSHADINMYQEKSTHA